MSPQSSPWPKNGFFALSFASREEGTGSNLARCSQPQFLHHPCDERCMLHPSVGARQPQGELLCAPTPAHRGVGEPSRAAEGPHTSAPTPEPGDSAPTVRPCCPPVPRHRDTEHRSPQQPAPEPKVLLICSTSMSGDKPRDKIRLHAASLLSQALPPALCPKAEGCYTPPKHPQKIPTHLKLRTAIQ